MGKVFIQEKDKLLQLADVIASSKERCAKEKVAKVKNLASAESKQSTAKRSKRRGQPPSERLRAAKELVAAQKAKHKRKKARARKAEEGMPSWQQETRPGSGGHGKSEEESKRSVPIVNHRKRVVFVD